MSSVIVEFYDNQGSLNMYISLTNLVDERASAGVKELVHVSTKGIPDVHLDTEHNCITHLSMKSKRETYHRLWTKAISHTKWLHRNVVDSEVITALDWRKGEGNNALKLRGDLEVTNQSQTNCIGVVIVPIDFTITKTTPAFFTFTFQLQIIIFSISDCHMRRRTCRAKYNALHEWLIWGVSLQFPSPPPEWGWMFESIHSNEDREKHKSAIKKNKNKNFWNWLKPF